MKQKWKAFKEQQARISELDDRTLLLNLYLTQAITLIIGVVWIWFQQRNPFELLLFPSNAQPWLWGIGLAAIVIIVDLLISRFVPDDVTDDGGVNERLFRDRPVWHIFIIALIVSICEELLFRGAIQFAIGPYWTSILFAAIHVRYLKHWVPTALVFSIRYAMGLMYEWTGSLWAPIMAHFVIDFVMGLILRYRREA
ncbi:CPBP family intramembrane metalloprotease [Paenibacillus sp. SC116]|uniref:CPBP family intramembrane glutamic endopeptidase n=1 Tax=Paenibacillus sp. SC116 TaxID=2968986 RepID=UPI00215AA37F|nr:type II CAAX endopeptidase family protein [Paenibacillus sp. SC116]MCR8842999.1 CPBP family intramembrane metalloprotease [Paenibacillus sp. SC116]